MLETVFILENQLFSFLFVFPSVLGYTVPKMLRVTPWKSTLLNLLIFLYIYKLYQIFFFLKEFYLQLVCNNKFIIKTSVHSSNFMVFSFSLRRKTSRKRFCSEVVYCQKGFFININSLFRQ